MRSATPEMNSSGMMRRNLRRSSDDYYWGCYITIFAGPGSPEAGARLFHLVKAGRL